MTSGKQWESVQLNGITYLRIALVPPVMWLILSSASIPHGAVIAAAVFAFAAFTDFLDGYLARRWRATSEVGSFLDTTADKLLVTGALIALIAVDRASPWIGLIIVGRELVILGLRAVAASAGTVVHASIWGKMKANVQFVAIVLAIARYPHPLGPLYLDQWAMIAAAVVTVLSGAEYVVRFAHVLTPNDRPER